MNDIGQNIITLLETAAKDLGATTLSNLEEARSEAQIKALTLAGLVGQPGYEEALVAARDILAMKLGLTAVATADSADAKVLSLLEGLLALAARAMSGGLA